MMEMGNVIKTLNKTDGKTRRKIQDRWKSKQKNPAKLKKIANGKKTTKNKPFILTDTILKTLKSFLYTEV